MLLKMEGGVFTSDKLQEVTGDVVIEFCKSLSVVQRRKMLFCICIGTSSQWICFSVLLYVDTSYLVACVVFHPHTEHVGRGTKAVEFVLKLFSIFDGW